MVKKRKPRVSKKFVPQASIVSDEIYLPNYSGEHTAGTTGTPIKDRDIANKKYVDDQNAFYVPITGGTFTGKVFFDGPVTGIDVLRSADIGINLSVGQNITVGGTVDGVDIAARDHAESHNAASHSDIASSGADIDDAVSKKHTQNTDTALGSGAVAADHGTAATDQIINVCYGTENPPVANTTTEGTIWMRYLA